MLSTSNNVSSACASQYFLKVYQLAEKYLLLKLGPHHIPPLPSPSVYLFQITSEIMWMWNCKKRGGGGCKIYFMNSSWPGAKICLESFCGDCQGFLRSVESRTLRGDLVSLSLSACLCACDHWLPKQLSAPGRAQCPSSKPRYFHVSLE